MKIQDASATLQEYVAREVSTEIHDNDHMYNSGPDHYDSVGFSAIMMIVSGLSIAWTESVKRILDLPCGHGRVARHLAAAFPESQKFFCDIDAEGAEFCAAKFGGKAIPSQPDLTKVELPENLDLIWVGSLFTHVDEARTRDWMHYLCRHLAVNGIVVATFHGLFSKRLIEDTPGMLTEAPLGEILDGYHSAGYGYSRYHDEKYGDYGISLCKADWVVRMASRIPGVRIISYTERGWAGNQDVLILSKTDRFKPF